MRGGKPHRRERQHRLEAAAKAAPDGYTLLVGNVSTNAINESMFAGQLSIRPSRDLVAITKLVEIPHIVVVNAAFPANNIAELVALAKKEPGKINYTSAGMGSYPHLDMERFMKASGTQITHVPYKGGAGQAIPAMVAGEVQLAFFNMASLLPHIKSGRLKALAAIPAQRLPELPYVQTLAEQGYPGIGTNAWQGIFAPAATPKPVVDKLYASVSAVLTAGGETGSRPENDGGQRVAVATRVHRGVRRKPSVGRLRARREDQDRTGRLGKALIQSSVMQTLRLLVSVALLLAIPAQGIAAVTGSLCMALGGHGAPAIEDAQHAHDGEAHGSSHDHDSGDDDGSSQSHCGPCVACCASAAIASVLAVPLPSAIASAPLPSSLPAPEASRPDRLERPPLEV